MLTVPVGYWRNYLLPNNVARIAGEGVLECVVAGVGMFRLRCIMQQQGWSAPVTVAMAVASYAAEGIAWVVVCDAAARRNS